jgi:hypothetical protein
LNYDSLAMRKLLIPLGLVAGCTHSDSTTPLSDLAKKYGDTNLELVVNGQVNIELHVSPTSGCPELSEELVATFDGVPMHIVRGGYDTNANGCYPIGFYAPQPLPADQLMGFERTTTASELVLVDRSSQWTVGTGRLFTNDFVIDRAAGTIEWQNVAAISTAQISPQAPVTIERNIIHYPKETAVELVQAYAHPVPSRCDGPALCTIDLEGTRDWVSNP